MHLILYVLKLLFLFSRKVFIMVMSFFLGYILIFEPLPKEGYVWMSLWIPFVISWWSLSGVSTNKCKIPAWFYFLITFIAVAIVLFMVNRFLSIESVGGIVIIPLSGIIGFLLYVIALDALFPLVVLKKYPVKAQLTKCFSQRLGRSNVWVAEFGEDQYTLDYFTFIVLSEQEGKAFSFIRCECIFGVVCMRSLRQVES